jgi:hypothetical protein
MADQEGTGQSNGFIVISQSPDVCKSPGAPIPYPSIFAFLGQSTLTSGNTNFQTFPVFSMGSRVTKSFGDEPGVGLGIKSGAVGGWCRPITEVPTVICNGQKLCRHEHTTFEMNCLGPEGPGNTFGKVYYLGAMLCGPVAPGGKPGSQQNPPLEAEKPEELSALDKIKNSLKVENIQDAVCLMKQAYELSKVDWSKPGAALGALAGMAGRAGLGDLSKLLKAGQKAADTDWSDPVKALKTAASIGGDLIKVGKSVGELLNSDAPDSPQQRQSTTPSQPDFLQQLKNGTAGTAPPSGEGPMCKPGDAVVVGIGGTSSGEPGTQDGHVEKLVRDYDTDASNKYFHDGPENMFPIGPVSSEMQQLEDDAYNHIKQRLAERPDLPVDIYGHSRGGYGAMQLAERLNAEGIKVRNLGLYDPVDMAVDYGGQECIPGNVQNSSVVRTRNDDTGGPDQSRESFRRPDSDLCDPSSGTRYASYDSTGSHAAVGGNPGTAPYNDSFGAFSGIEAEQNEVTESRNTDEFIRQNAQNGGAVIKPRDDYDTHSQNQDLVRMSKDPKK